MKKALLFLCSLTLAASAHAENQFIQTGDGTFDWSTAANWSPAAVPNSTTDQATFNASGYVITNNATVMANVSSPVTLATLYFAGSSTTGANLTVSGSPITLNNTGGVGWTATVQNMSVPANVAVTVASDLVLADPDGVSFNAYNQMRITGNISGSGQVIRSGSQDQAVFLGGNNTFTGGISIVAGYLEAAATNAFVNTSGNLTFANATGYGGISTGVAGTTTFSAGAINFGGTSQNIRFASGGTGSVLDITTSNFTNGSGTGAINILKSDNQPLFGVNTAGIGTVKFSGTDFTVTRNVTGAQYNSSGIELSPASGTQTWSGNFTGFVQQQSDSSTNPSVVKSGNGTVILSGANTYRSQTLVNAGTLLLNNTNIQAVNPYTNDSGLGSATKGRYEVANGATLGGTGRINVALANAAATANNAVLVKSGGIVAPGGATAIGTLTFDGANFTRNGTDDHVLNMATESKFSFRLSGNSASADQVDFWNYANGDLLLSGGSIAVNLTLSSLGDGASHTVTLFKFYSDGGTTIFSGENLTSGLTLGTVDPNISGTPTFSYTSGGIDLTYTAVPEPATWALLALTGTCFMVTRRLRRD